MKQIQHKKNTAGIVSYEFRTFVESPNGAGYIVVSDLVEDDGSSMHIVVKGSEADLDATDLWDRPHIYNHTGEYPRHHNELLDAIQDGHEPLLAGDLGGSMNAYRP